MYNKFIAICFILAFVGCKKTTSDTPESNYEDFNNYITNYSKSPVSRCQDVFVHLAFPLDSAMAVPKDLFNISPSIGGQYALDPSRKRITIKGGEIKHNVLYHVKFNINQLTEMPEGLETFEFDVEAKKQAWDIQMDPPANKSMDIVTYTGTITYTDCEPDRNVLNESLSARQGNDVLSISWNHNKNNQNVSEFTIQNIKRKEEPDEVELVLSMEAINVDDKATLNLAIPSKSDFSLHSVKIENNKHLRVTFTDPILESQNLVGLFKMKDRKISRYRVNANTVDLYFEKNNYGFYDLEILPGIKNLAGFSLKDSYTQNLFFTPPSPLVNITEKGNILPSTGSWDLPISLITANGFRLRVLKIYEHNVHRFYQENSLPYESQMGLENLGRIVLDTVYKLEIQEPFVTSVHNVALDNLIRKEKGAMYKLFLSIPDEHNLFPCQEVATNRPEDDLDKTDFDRPWITYSYDYEYYGGGNSSEGRRYYSDYTSNNTYAHSPCNNYQKVIHDGRILMCSDIGMVIKSEPDKKRYFGYVSEITTANPLANVKLELYNVQGGLIQNGYSNASGIVNVAVGDQVPFLAKATYGNETTYLQLMDSKALSLSTFQVEGRQWDGDKKVFFYGDRDVWRPGDSIFMHSIVFSPDKSLPERLPVNLKLYDPSNKLVRKWNVLSNNQGLYDCRFTTDLNDPTGYWRMEMVLGGKSHFTPVRVETIRPNRLKMNMAFANETMISNSDSKQAPMEVKWMHGLEAKDLTAEIEMFQKKLVNPFGTDYQNYVFDDITKTYQEELGLVQSGNTNAKGVLDYTIQTLSNTTYPSIMLFNFQLRAFEKGGAFSSDMKSIKYSPFTHYIGAKFPAGNTSGSLYIKKDEAILLAAVDQNGRPASREVQVKLQKLTSEWWYQFGNSGNYAAISNNVTGAPTSYNVRVGKEGKPISIKQYGRYLLTLTDTESGHTMKRVIYSYDDSWREDSENMTNLEVLPFVIDKTDYAVGDNLSFDLPPASNGRYLVTVEGGGRIIHKEVHRTRSIPTNINLSISEQMVPTAYVHVHLIQGWNGHNNDRPLRLFGIKPINVYDPGTVLKPKIEMPSEITADEDFVIKVREEQGRSMTYTLAVVDEGLLDITQFNTPDPWHVFFGKESLNIRTWDMYRDIFHKFLGEYASLLAIGGDGSNAIAPSAKARRFKPVVKFLGPFTLGNGQTSSHKLNIKDYVGSVRAMVVATNGKALGNQAKSAPVKKPLMIYTTVPRVLGPGEKMKIPVTVFAMKDDVKNVRVTLKTDDQINILGDKVINVQFDKTGEKDIEFEIETKDMVGVAQIEVESKSGSYSHREATEVDLRPSAAVITKTIHEMVKAGESEQMQFEAIGMPGTRSAKLNVSRGLNFSFAPQVDWLSRYPHGCLEQTVSTIFPQIFLYQMNLLDQADAMKYRQQYGAAIQKMRYMQLPNGGFSYWSGGNKANAWGTSYALNFLLEAKRMAYDVPEDMLKKCIQYQFKAADNWKIVSVTNSRGENDYSSIDQAYRLYTLALAGKPNYAAMNRLRLAPNLHNTAKWMLAHALFIVGEDKLADQIIARASDQTTDYRELGGNFGSNVRDQAFIIRVLLAKGEKIKAKRLVDELLPNFNDKNIWRMSTQDRAHCLISFAQFVGTLENVEDSIRYDLILPNSGKTISEQVGKSPNIYPVNLGEEKEQEITLLNQGKSELFASVEVTGLPMRDESRSEAQDLSMTVEYFEDGGGKIDPKNIKKGQDFVVQYTIKHDGKRMSYENMALTAIFPSGWEIINQRMHSNSSFNAGDNADYSDIRDDRVYLYFDLAKGKKKVFRLKLNATYAGKYWASPAFCEAMYDASIRAKDAGFWAEVK